MEPVEPLYKECQWHTNEDQTMCGSKASIWWKTVHWSQCNSHEGMHRQILVPSRYLSNFKEELCLLSFPLRGFSRAVPFIVYLHGLKLLAALLFIGLYTKLYWGAHRIFDSTEARHTRERKGNN